MTKRITSFSGTNRFLSNFYPAPITFKGHTYPSVEHAYQAYKTDLEEERDLIRKCKTAREAKNMSSKITLRRNWNIIKYEYMLVFVRLKFKETPELAKRLLATGDAELIEGNTWGDTYWGVCKGKGQNKLGEILMMVRNELKEQ